MSRLFDDLTPRFRPVAIELVARCVEAGIPVMIVDTKRTRAEHEENLAKGVSWTSDSRHIYGEAIDLAPYDEYRLYGPDKLQWDGDDPAWERIGAVGEKLGLKWGVWKKSAAVVPAWRCRGEFVNVDVGHFEMPAVRPSEAIA